MSADRSELHELVDELPDNEVLALLADARRRARPRPARTVEPFAWVGAIKDGPADASSPERIDEMLGKGFGRG